MSISTNVWMHWVDGNGEGRVVPVQFLLLVRYLAVAATSTALGIAHAHHSEYYQRYNESDTDEHHYCHAHSCIITIIIIIFSIISEPRKNIPDDIIILDIVKTCSPYS